MSTRHAARISTQAVYELSLHVLVCMYLERQVCVHVLVHVHVHSIPQELLTSLNIDQPYIMTSIDNDVATYIINEVIIDFVTSFK